MRSSIFAQTFALDGNRINGQPTDPEKLGRLYEDLVERNLKEKQTEPLHDNDLTSSGVNVSINKFNRATVRDTQYLDEAGNVDWAKWAPNNGSVAGTTKTKQILSKNIIIDRYGDTYGAYVSPIGIPYQQRSLLI